MKPNSFLVAAIIATAGCSPTSAPAPRAARAATPQPTSAPPAAAAIVVPIPRDLALDPDVADAVQVVANAEAFGGEQVSYDGHPVPAVVALRTLARAPQASRVLSLVVDHGTRAGQLLALAGLYRVDHAAFEQRLVAYRGATDTVRVHRGGCDPSLDDQVVGVLVEAPGAMQLARPDETLAEWVRRNPGNRALVLDLVGGGRPLTLLGYSP